MLYMNNKIKNIIIIIIIFSEKWESESTRREALKVKSVEKAE